MLVPAALAFDVQDIKGNTLPHVATRLVVAERSEGTRIVALGAEAVDLVDPSSRAVVATVGRGALDVVARDDELWLCDADGVWRVDADLGEPTQVLTEACVTFAAFEGGFIVAGASLVRWWDDGAGGLEAGEEVAEGSFALLAGDGTSVVAGGGTTIVVVTITETTTLDAGGDVRGVAMIGGVAAWTIDDALVDTVGARTELAEGPGALVEADLDADGIPEIVVDHANSLGVVKDGVEVVFSMEGWDDAIVVVPDEGDRIWGLGADGTEVRIARDMNDLDGDGWTTAAGDCDDQDPDSYPGGADVPCLARDFDCDGVVTWYGGDWLPNLAVLEGHTVGIELDACFDDVYVAVDFPEYSGAYCTGSVERVNCTGEDDAVVTLIGQVYARSGGALVDQREAEFAVVNAAPEIGLCLDDNGYVALGGYEYAFEVDEAIVCTLAVADVADDEVLVELLEGPPGLVLNGDVLTWTPGRGEVGTWEIVVAASDEDGGWTERTMEVTVWEPSDGSCCSCLGAAFVVCLVGVGSRRQERLPER